MTPSTDIEKYVETLRQTITKLELHNEDLLDQKARLCGSYQQLMEDYQALEIKHGILELTSKNAATFNKQ